jgi:serine/threonine protein phosphatase PrpC
VESASVSSNQANETESYLVGTDKQKKQAVFTEGFLKTTFDIRRRSFDCNYSGSTVVSIMISGTSLICANVGDSRAILSGLRPKGYHCKPNETLGQIQGDKQWMA